MVIFVPRGEQHDATRKTAFYDATFEYLSAIGIPTVSSQADLR
jgi:hypothetical protein